MEILLLIVLAVVLVLFVAPAFPYLPVAACLYLLVSAWNGLKALAKKAAQG